MGMNVMSGESRKAISALYRTCQPAVDQRDPTKHDLQKIHSVQGRVILGDWKTRLYVNQADRRGDHQGHHPWLGRGYLTYSKRYEPETTFVPGKPNV